MESFQNSDQPIGKFLFIRHSESEYIKHFEDRLEREAKERRDSIDGSVTRTKHEVEIAHNLDALQPHFVDSILTKVGIEKSEQAGL